MTVLGAEDIQRTGAPNVADVLNQLPSVRPSLTPTSSTNHNQYTGGNYLDLRGLGFNRTLVLVDGKRFVSTSIFGPVDINVVPQALLAGVEVVTGGASAAWGSDAVAGVVNLRLDHNLEGFKGSIQGGVTDHNDYRNYLASVAYGLQFGDGRGRLVMAAEAAENSGIDRLDSRDWGAKAWGIIANPAYTPTNAEPQRLLVSNVRTANTSFGGLINSGPLRGTQFAPDGSAVPFQYGQLVTTSSMVGGDGSNGSGSLVLAVPLQRRSAYGRVSYDFSDAVRGYAELSYSKSKSPLHNGLTATDTAIPIRNDNAYLPASIKAAMAANNITSFTLGRNHEDFARPIEILDNETKRVVAGLEGDLGAGWTWEASYTHGSSYSTAVDARVKIVSRFNLAVDAVVNPSTGAIVCRSTLTNPQNGCVPLNLFGQGAPSPAARNYALGTATRAWDLKQDAAAIVVRGEPLSTWAGPVSLAAGAEYRRDSAEVTADPLSAAGEFFLYNTTPWKGEVTVKEAFGEVVVPLAAGQAWAKAIDLDLAVRVTDYSTSGRVSTWKAGVTYDLNDQVRFRATRSRDIRAPSMAELFQGTNTLQFGVLDPVTGQNTTIAADTRGNPGLKPEKADTLTAGVVLSPAFLPNLRVSLDYYSIDLKQAILSLAAASIVERCYRDQPELCRLITRGSSGLITRVETSPQNLQLISTSGADLEIAYRTPFGPGDLSFRNLVTYLHKTTLDDGRSVIELAGSTDQPTISAVGGLPHWRSNTSVTYEMDPYSVTLTGRYVGGGKINNAFDAKALNVLETSGRFYVDLSAQFGVLKGEERNATIFAAVTNLLDTDPPITGTGGFATVRALYDVIGRTYTVGLRFRY
jgi:outer membrane receptor protein involved in Fe transport